MLDDGNQKQLNRGSRMLARRVNAAGVMSDRWLLFSFSIFESNQWVQDATLLSRGSDAPGSAAAGAMYSTKNAFQWTKTRATNLPTQKALILASALGG
jgi:hypothetical protein